MSIGVVLWVTVTGRVAKRLFNWAHPTANPVRRTTLPKHHRFGCGKLVLACAVTCYGVFSNVAMSCVICVLRAGDGLCFNTQVYHRILIVPK